MIFICASVPRALSSYLSFWMGKMGQKRSEIRSPNVSCMYCILDTFSLVAVLFFALLLDPLHNFLSIVLPLWRRKPSCCCKESGNLVLQDLSLSAVDFDIGVSRHRGTGQRGSKRFPCYCNFSMGEEKKSFGISSPPAEASVAFIIANYYDAYYRAAALSTYQSDTTTTDAAGPLK